jgi:prolyl-tRNA editing enzyme YbaK/EbsC (Cys-tRNA(Pro) deacylase)
MERAYIDQRVLSNPVVIAGGGDINKLVEVKTIDIQKHVRPIVGDFVRE